MKATFLTTEQQSELTSLNWRLNPKGKAKYLTLYRDDFNLRSWEEVCQQLDISMGTDSIDILYVGIQTNP